MPNSPSRKRPCMYCRIDLNLWGPDRHGVCPDCATARRSIKIQCGRCRKPVEIGRMELVSLFYSPGKKGSKKMKIYYCPTCFISSRSKVLSVVEEQQRQINIGEDRLKRVAQMEQASPKDY